MDEFEKQIPEIDIEKMSPRQRQIALLMCAGNTYLGVTEVIEIKQQTVNTHMSRLYKKFPGSNLANVAYNLGLAKGRQENDERTMEGSTAGE